MVEYTLNEHDSKLYIYGPYAKWLHDRLTHIKGTKYNKETGCWITNICFKQVVIVVIKTYLNNLSKAGQHE